MAIVVSGFAAQTIADLMTAVNTYLATLTNPKVHAVDVYATEAPRTVGRSYGCIVTTETGGGVIATPWTLTVYEGQTPVAVATLAAAYVAANPAAFIAAPKLRTWYIESGSQLLRWSAVILANATGGASANWLPT